MPRIANARYQANGTRFRLYPQPKVLEGFEEPQIVYVNSPPGSIKAGPEDDILRVIDAVDKVPYNESGEWPPYTGPRHEAAAEPGPDGHFDRIRPGTRAFSAAAMFATVRFTLDVWERYFGRKLGWYFRDAYPRLELIPRVETDNAWSRFGYLECGFPEYPDDRDNPYAENFDVVAHEIGHCMLREVIGNPMHRNVIGTPFRTMPVEFRAHDEAAADLVALVASLHFDTVVEALLRATRGNLFSGNVLTRIGELSKQREEIRIAFNNQKMSNVKWHADPVEYKYRLSEPFTGGAFDVLVEIYLRNLIEREVLPEKLVKRTLARAHRHDRAGRAEIAAVYEANEKQFAAALVDARDYFGRMLAWAWTRTSLDNVSFPGVVDNLIKADQELGTGKHRNAIRRSFEWRQILPRERAAR